MRKSLVALTVALLLLTTLSASAGAPALGSFSTTGYTTNLLTIPGYPYLIPTDLTPLPGGYAKFHIHAQGGPAYDDDTVCQEVYGLTCENVCKNFPIYPGGPGTGEACGARGYFEGSFAFDEWAIVDATAAGANEGLLTVSTGSGSADMRFGGTATSTADGSFQILGGSGDYKKLAGVGTYTGNPGYVFTVGYTPCGGDGQGACPTPFCATRGGTLKLQKAKATWDLVNDGQQPVVLNSLLLFWPEANGALNSVSLDGKTIVSGSWPAPWVQLDLSSAPAADRETRGGKTRNLTLEFENRGISGQPADYTFQADFAEGCTAIHVAFAP